MAKSQFVPSNLCEYHFFIASFYWMLFILWGMNYLYAYAFFLQAVYIIITILAYSRCFCGLHCFEVQDAFHVHGYMDIVKIHGYKDAVKDG
jgi:hypothetical protein